MDYVKASVKTPFSNSALQLSPFSLAQIVHLRSGFEYCLNKTYDMRSQSKACLQQYSICVAVQPLSFTSYISEVVFLIGSSLVHVQQVCVRVPTALLLLSFWRQDHQKLFHLTLPKWHAIQEPILNMRAETTWHTSPAFDIMHTWVQQCFSWSSWRSLHSTDAPVAIC